jgi:hypothetical protein
MAHHAKASEKIGESFEKVRESFEGIRLVLERGFESVGISGVLTAAGGAISIEELIKTTRWLLEGLSRQVSELMASATPMMVIRSWPMLVSVLTSVCRYRSANFPFIASSIFCRIY